MSEPAYTRKEIELLLFEVEGSVFGADASQVLRIDRATSDTDTSSPLGKGRGGGRALVFQAETGLGQLKVDLVMGVRQVAVASLRRLPPAAAAQPYAIGVWLNGETPVLLIDLEEMHKFQGRQ